MTMNTNEVFFIVAAYEGRVSVRQEDAGSTTVYADETLAYFDTEEEANLYAKSVEASVWAEHVAVWTCPHCGHFQASQNDFCDC